jgi:protein-S-isoprenylcysteine O-methyltransferase Ste14
MELFPTPAFGLFNGWLLAAVLYLVFGILLLLFPRPVVARLYDRSLEEGRRTLERLLGLLLFLGWMLLAIVTPLSHVQGVLRPGLALYALGFLGFVAALRTYAATPVDRPVATGLYRLSRHPQQCMLWLSFLGISIAMGSWIAVVVIGIGLVGAHRKVVAEEEACLRRYGEPYRQYLERVPRYFLLR